MKFFTVARNLHSLKNDPFGFIVETIIKVIVNLVIPFPLSGEIIAQLKGPVLGLLASVVILGIMLFVILITIFISIFASPTGFFQFLSLGLEESKSFMPSQEFIQSVVPSQNPFGGQGMAYTSITAGFMDPAYFIQFGRNHTGIDLVPSASYYEGSQTYQQNKKAIIYATHLGKATTYIDEEGGETVEVLNTAGDIKTIYIHFKEVYVNSGDDIQAGIALGEMGGSGRATGEHLHYEIRVKDANNWLPVNPLTYIK